MSTAQTGCGGGRYISEVFSAYDVIPDVIFGQNVNLQGQNTSLGLDFYSPQGDAIPKRPLVILAHGGNFIGGDKAAADVLPLSESLARSGFAVASINYRVGVAGIPFPGPSDADIQESVLRAVHDMKAAVRFFYKDAATTNTYGIDTNLIFVGGASAGAVTALHYAYLDDLAELPAGIDTTQAGLGGGLPGLSGNLGYSDRVAGVVNLSGALDEATWLIAGDEPLVSTHAVADDVIPIGTGQLTFLGVFQLMVVDGSQTIDTRASSVGVSSCIYKHEGAGVTHVPHAGSAAYLDTTMVVIRNFLNEQICAVTSTNCQYVVGLDNAQAMGFEIQVQPNPSHSDFEFELQGAGSSPWGWELIDVSGKRMMQAEAQAGARVQVRRMGLPAGLYVLRVQTDQAVQTRKIILN